MRKRTVAGDLRGGGGPAPKEPGFPGKGPSTPGQRIITVFMSRDPTLHPGLADGFSREPLPYSRPIKYLLGDD